MDDRDRVEHSGIHSERLHGRFKPDHSDHRTSFHSGYFLHSERNLQNTGIRLQHGDRWFTLRMKFAFNPQDFAAHEDMYDLKGSSGLAPCPCCDNCMGRRGFFDDDGPIAHVYSWKYDRFKSRTPERAADIVNNLRDLADNPAELETMEMATGIKYNPNGILFDREVSIIMKYPFCVYIDLTHALYGSGGIAKSSDAHRLRLKTLTNSQLLSQFVVLRLSCPRLSSKTECRRNPMQTSSPSHPRP
jgi:hypothetical protein